MSVSVEDYVEIPDRMIRFKGMWLSRYGRSIDLVLANPKYRD